jgi:hypothetical protein
MEDTVKVVITLTKEDQCRIREDSDPDTTEALHQCRRILVMDCFQTTMKPDLKEDSSEMTMM